MEKKKILITFGTRPLALRVARGLKEAYDIRYASSEEMPDLLLKSGHYFKIPPGLLPTYAHEVLKICLDEEIDYVLPLGEFEIMPLAESKVLFDEYNVRILVPDKELLDELPIFENPPVDLPLILLSNGVNLIDQSVYPIEMDGLLAAGDSGEDLALCCVSK